MNTNSAPEALEQIIRRAAETAVSDIHLQMSATGAQVSFRLDGLLTPTITLERDLAERVFGRIKFLSHLKTYQESLPQDGRINKEDVHSTSDLRVSTYPTVTGEKIVLRLFAETSVPKLEELELPADAREALARFLKMSSGMLLLTGPAGSGKTTTIYACLRQLSEVSGRHVITIEDPVERIIPGIMQTEINEARGLNFATAARHLLRQDPQVLVIGEIRDDETANLAVRAALTGHLVISTLHAGSCKGVFERLFVMCPDKYAVVSGVQLVLNQRLIRRLCSTCSGKGCDHCLQSGYRGRLPLVEWLHLTDEVRAQLRNTGPEAIKPAVTLDRAAEELCSQGKTSSMEVQRLLGRSPLG